jgi:hypothetical protein
MRYACADRATCMYMILLIIIRGTLVHITGSEARSRRHRWWSSRGRCLEDEARSVCSRLTRTTSRAVLENHYIDDNGS